MGCSRSTPPPNPPLAKRRIPTSVPSNKAARDRQLRRYLFFCADVQVKYADVICGILQAREIQLDPDWRFVLGQFVQYACRYHHKALPTRGGAQ